MRALLLIVPLAAIGFAGCSATGDSSSFDYDQLRVGMSAAEVHELPPKRPLTCKVPVSGQGLSMCEAVVTKIDGLRAAQLKYYFVNDKLEAAKVVYSPGAYEDVAKMMDSRYKRAEVTPPGHGVWKVAGGAVISSSTDLENGNVYTYWGSID